MIEWTEQHKQIRDMLRRFVEAEIAPNREELEFGDTPPYAVLRKLMTTFGVDEMAKAQFQADIEREKRGDPPKEKKARTEPSSAAMDAAAMRILPIVELCRYSLGMVTALGVS